MAKISIIGSGNVGATVALLCAQKKYGKIALVDVAEGIPQGKALDIMQALPLSYVNTEVAGSNSYDITKDSDIAVITAGIARKPGMSRDDLLATNTKIVKDVTEQVVKYSPNCVIIVVSNPLDAMVYVASAVSRLPKNRVVGMAGVLDSARMRYFISQELKVNPSDTSAIVIGGHGDDMVPLESYTKVRGSPIANLADKETLKRIFDKTKNGGIEIVNYLKTGSAFVAPAASIVEMIDSIVHDKKKVLPCAAYCGKEYGVGGYYVGVPVKLGRNGVEGIVELELTAEEKSAFKQSVEHVKEMVKGIKI